MLGDFRDPEVRLSRNMSRIRRTLPGKAGAANRRKPDAARSRAARSPDFGFTTSLIPGLFTVEDVGRLTAEAAAKDRNLQPRSLTDAELLSIAQHLRHAFQWAMDSDQMQQWSSEPERARRWHERIASRAHSLLEALDLDPDECGDAAKELPASKMPSITTFRLFTDGRVGACPVFPDHPDRLARVVWDEAERLLGDGIDATGHCLYRARASFLIDRLPRTLALLAAIARWQVAQSGKRGGRRGDHPDRLAGELFKQLAAVHELIFRGKPATRGKTGRPIGGSIGWARAVIRHAADRIDTAPKGLPARPNESTKSSAAERQQYADWWTTVTKAYVQRFKQLADLSDRRIADRLDEGWREWQMQKALRAQ
jgi:hypothetical protein